MIGTIFKGIGGFYYVHTVDGETVECRARGKFRNEHIIPMIGDKAEIDVKNGKGSITGIYPRRNKLLRPAVANIDTVVIVAAAKSPDPIPMLIDRMLVNAEINDIEPVVCINKRDLADCGAVTEIYRNAGYRTLEVSAETGLGIDELFSVISGRTAAFAGASGVGKSSLLTLITGSSLETGSVSEKINRGRHTTRHVELFSVRGGGYVLDTPGFSSIEAEDITPEQLAQCFPEMRKAAGQCRFRSCAHIDEPDCAVKALLASGELAPSRYESYKELYKIQRSKKAWK